VAALLKHNNLSENLVAVLCAPVVEESDLP